MLQHLSELPHKWFSSILKLHSVLLCLNGRVLAAQVLEKRGPLENGTDFALLNLIARLFAAWAKVMMSLCRFLFLSVVSLWKPIRIQLNGSNFSDPAMLYSENGFGKKRFQKQTEADVLQEYITQAYKSLILKNVFFFFFVFAVFNVFFLLSNLIIPSNWTWYNLI